jgi:hypothetical protein
MLGKRACHQSRLSDISGPKRIAVLSVFRNGLGEIRCRRSSRNDDQL